MLDSTLKKLTLAAVLLSWSFLVQGAAGAPAAPDSARTITLVADAWPPFNCAVGEDPEGYLIDVARAVFEPLGYRVEYLNIPWKRALSGTQAGQFDGAVGPSKVEGPGLVFPDHALLLNRVSFYVRRDSDWRFEVPASLDGVVVGAALGYDYVGWLNTYLEENRNDPGKVQALAGDFPLRQNLRKLLSGRIDVLAGNEGSIRFVALQLGILDEIKPAGYDPEVSNCYIAFSPATGTGELYAGILSRGIEELRRSGEFAAILARYGLADWADPPGGSAP